MDEDKDPYVVFDDGTVVADGAPADTEGAQPTSTESADAVWQKLIRMTQERNRGVAGSLVLHAPSRDITLAVDGDAGLRAVGLFCGMLEFEDPLMPAVSSAANGWAGIDFDRLLAVSWIPDGVAIQPGRRTIDPAR